AATPTPSARRSGRSRSPAARDGRCRSSPSGAASVPQTSPNTRAIRLSERSFRARSFAPTAQIEPGKSLLSSSASRKACATDIGSGVSADSMNGVWKTCSSASHVKTTATALPSKASDIEVPPVRRLRRLPLHRLHGQVDRHDVRVAGASLQDRLPDLRVAVLRAALLEALLAD